MKNKRFEVGDKVKLDAEVVAVDGDNVVVRLDIVTTHKDLLKFDDPQETSPFID